MATKNQTAQDTAMLKRLAAIAERIERCRDDLQPYMGSECAGCGDVEHGDFRVIQAATLVQVAADEVDLVLWALTPPDERVEAEQSSNQGTAMIKALDAILDEIEAGRMQLYEYHGAFAPCLDEIDGGHAYDLDRAATLLDVAGELIDRVIWSLSPEGQQAHAEHSQQ